MKLGLSTYSLSKVLSTGEMSIVDAVKWIGNNGFEHAEIVPFYIELVDEKTGEVNTSLVESIKNAASDTGIFLSTFSLNADLIKETTQEKLDEVARVKLYVDMAAKLGVESMRFDIASFRRPFEINGINNFVQELEGMTKASQEIADYAYNEHGLVTTLENHGYFVNGSDRVLMLLDNIDRDYVNMTLDVGNFLCVNENPVPAVQKCLPHATRIHLKDFYIRDVDKLPFGENYKHLVSMDERLGFPTLSLKQAIIGSIIGFGDLDMVTIIKMIQDSGFDGPATIEFEGLEENKFASKTCLENVKYILNK